MLIRILQKIKTPIIALNLLKRGSKASLRGLTPNSQALVRLLMWIVFIHPSNIA
jgi:hypothetical protein